MEYAYSLTDLTGQRRNDGRQMVVATFEVRRHGLIVTALGLLASMVLVMPLLVILGGYAFILPAIGIPLAHLLFAARQRRGLKVYRYTSLLNARRAARGFWINGMPFANPMFIMHQPTTADIPAHRAKTLTRAGRATELVTAPQPIRGVRKRDYVREPREGARRAA